MFTEGITMGPVWVKIMLIVFSYVQIKTGFEIIYMCFINNYIYSPNYFYVFELILLTGIIFSVYELY